MPIHFTPKRMQKVIEHHELWWEGKLGRPLACITVDNAHEPDRECGIPVLSQRNCHLFSYTPEQVIEALDVELSRKEFFGDAYPHVTLEDFGPGVLAAFCGAVLDNSSGAVWFFPKEKKEISEIHAVYDPENVWTKRVKDICRAGVDRWQGSVLMGFPDLGGNLDVAASLVGTEELLFACIEEPEEVERLCGEIQTAWFAAYNDFAEIIGRQGCYTDWHGLISRKPSYVLQNDFTAMISNEMFDRFALGILRDSTERLGRSVYHLDGPDAVKHLDSLLTLDRLGAVQWQFGDGQPGPMHWLDVYNKIKSAGKSFVIVGGYEGYLEVMKELSGTDPYFDLHLDKSETDAVEKILSVR